MGYGQSPVPGLEPHAPLVDHAPESLDELRRLTRRLATTLDELTDQVREWRAKAGDETVQLHAHLQALERRINKLETFARRTGKSTDNAVQMQTALAALETRI